MDIIQGSAKTLRQIWGIFFLLLLITSASTCLQHSCNLTKAFYPSLVIDPRPPAPMDIFSPCLYSGSPPLKLYSGVATVLQGGAKVLLHI